MNDVFVSIVRILFFLFMLGVVWNIIKMLVSAIADKIKPFVGIVVIIGGLIFGNYLIGECINPTLGINAGKFVVSFLCFCKCSINNSFDSS